MSVSSASVVCLAALLPLVQASQIRIDERVDVNRVLVDVRVTDARGQPIRGLEAGDFVVELDGRRATVEWAQWIGTGGLDGRGSSSRSGDEQAGLSAPPGQVLFLYQKDLMSSRVEGLLRMMRESVTFIDRLEPEVGVAVLVFDSRLRVWQDFTTDRRRVRDGLGRGTFAHLPADQPVGASIRERLVAVDAHEAHTPERALQAIGRALEPLPGAKSLVMFGYGFGRLHAPFGDLRTSRADLDLNYDAAREALLAARVTVFALDISNADFHSLETSLMDVAEDTGGFYARTHDFPGAALDRLDGSLQGHYVVSIDKPTSVAATRGRHTITVKTTRRGATVLARRDYRD